jgi:hypothetical protein
MLLSPSWLSGLVAIVSGLVLSAGVIVAFSLNNSAFQQQLLGWQQNQPQQALTTPNQTLTENDRPTLQGSWPLLLLWSVVGLGVYAIVATILHDINRAAELRQSLDYVNARPQTALASTAEHLLLRLIATVVAIVFATFFVRQIVPYVITVAHASASDVLSLDGALYSVLAFSLVVVSVHIQTILLRLALGKARVFPGA